MTNDQNSKEMDQEFVLNDAEVDLEEGINTFVFLLS